MDDGSGQRRVRAARELVRDVMAEHLRGDAAAASVCTELLAFVAQTRRLVGKASKKTAEWKASVEAQHYVNDLRLSLWTIPANFAGPDGPIAKQLALAASELAELRHRCRVFRLIAKVFRRAVSYTPVACNPGVIDFNQVTNPRFLSDVIKELRTIVDSIAGPPSGLFGSRQLIRLTNDARKLLMHLRLPEPIDQLDSDLIPIVSHLREIELIAKQVVSRASHVPVPSRATIPSSVESKASCASVASRVRIFISYNHTDTRWMRLLQLHLEVATDVDAWSDHDISGGEDIRPAIMDALATCDGAILLLSGPALKSPFITEEEVPRLLQRRKQEGIPVIPLLLRPCLWNRVAWLSRMNIRPKFGTAIALLRPPAKQEQTVVAVADELLHLIELRERSSLT